MIGKAFLSTIQKTRRHKEKFDQLEIFKCMLNFKYLTLVKLGKVKKTKAWKKILYTINH